MLPQGIKKRLHLHTRGRNEHGKVITHDAIDYGIKAVPEALDIIRKEMEAGHDVQATWEYKHG